MLVIKFAGEHVVTWDEDNAKWVCDDKQTMGVLNFTVPDDILNVDTPYRTGGQQGVAYRAAKAAFGNLIKIVKRRDPQPPKEQEGVCDNVG